MRGLVYTAVFGKYDALKIPTVMTEGWDYICYSNMMFETDIWKIVNIKKYPLTNVKTSKMIKILWHLFFRDYDYIIWVDASLRIRCDLTKFVQKNYKDKMVVMSHPCRTCLYDEAKTVVSEGIDRKDVVDAQMDFYRTDGMPKGLGLTANGVMIHDPKVSVENFNFFLLWWNQVLTYSKRDQLSFMYAAWKTGFEYDTIPYSTINNEFKFERHKK